MKKKIIIPIVILLVLVICGLTWFILNNNKIVSTITLDINPSIELQLNKKNEVVNVIPLNDDAKIIVDDSLKGLDLNNALDKITHNVIDKGFVKDLTTIIVHAEGINNKEVETVLSKSFEERNIQTNIIVVENVTKEDEEFASKHGVSPAKASYINDIAKENENIDAEVLIEKPVDELEETKQRGVYCDAGYTLDGDFCIKELRREPLKDGQVCPEGYFEQDGKCYEQAEGTTTEKLVCNREWVLEDGKCYYRETVNAIAAKMECIKGVEKTKGELEGTDSDEKVCVDLSKATHPVSPCEANDGTEYTRANGKCYWHKAPVIASGCPGKIKVNGFCWDDASNVLICKGYRDGRRYKSRDEYCEHSIKIIEPTVTEYRCDGDFILEGNKCKREIVEDPHNEKICPSGYTLLDSGHCINKKKTVNKTNGKYCENPNSKVENNECIIYDIIPVRK